MGFTKLDERILQSSIMAESPVTFKVWITLLAACESNGIAYVSAVYLSSICHLPLARVEAALERLESPDPYSRSLDDEGRRIRRVDGGYEIINYGAYRGASLKDAEAERKRLYRRDGPRRKEGYIYFAKAESRIKIGFSQNPWARVAELKTANPLLELIAAIPGNLIEERELHDKYSHLCIEREWFEFTNEILEEIERLKSRSPDDDNRSPDDDNRSPDYSASASSSSSSSSSKEDSSSRGESMRGDKTPHSEDLRLVQLLIDLMQQNNPGSLTLKHLTAAKQAEWLRQCRLLREADGKSPEDIEAVIRFSQADEFWKSNILSMGKLRAQWDKLWLKARNADPHAGLKEWLKEKEQEDRDGHS